ncbi:hypothetical protein EZV62_004232 [Acer yangbiense]|uniref:Uncharacterized protein n=1 Tax=Acer yangbiense TaxID=1000413 RepID=A0A5C7IIU9_9ROSI|nr:hypothetical protein EZV62_004232 [Acer yangbiense]
MLLNSSGSIGNYGIGNRDAKCCNSQTIKCWRHYLKDAEIYCFQSDGDEEPYDIDDLNKELPELPLGDLYFRLDWRCNEA